MKETSKISLNEYLMLLSLGLMPPLLKLIPSQEAMLAGTAGWLAPLMALGPVLAGIALIAAVGKRLPENAGLGEAFCLWLGKGVGRVLCVVYGVWLLMLASIALRFCAERFTSTIYPETGMGLFFLVILGLEWYLGRRKLAVTARAAQIFFYMMLTTLGVVLLLGISSVKSYNIAPVWVEDVPKLVQASVPLNGAMSVAVGWLFLFGEVTERQKGGKRALIWGVWMILAMTALGFVVMGVFGKAMVVRLQIPFFSLSKEVRIGSAVQRVEPLVVTMWVFADVISTALLLRSAERAFGCAFGLSGRLNGALLAVVLPGAYLCAGSFFALDRLYQGVFVPVTLILFVGMPIFAMAIGSVRRR